MSYVSYLNLSTVLYEHRTYHRHIGNAECGASILILKILFAKPARRIHHIHHKIIFFLANASLIILFLPKTKECDQRGASAVYTTHIFDQADEWASHIAFMQLDKVLSPIHELATFQPYQEILERSGKLRSMCPMYTLVLEELERQYRQQSDVFCEDNQCLEDVIMEKTRGRNGSGSP